MKKITDINIPKVVCEVDDKKMLERIVKFKAGAMRIIVFTIVGMIIGWFGYTYTTDSFIVTKIIFAIPYKISEAIYTTIIGTGYSIYNSTIFEPRTVFFQHSFIATFLAEHITPVFLGGAIFGCLAYFTGDKKVFTMNRFVKFTIMWISFIVLYVGLVYGVNTMAEYKNNHLNNVDYFFLMTKDQGGSILNKEGADKVLKAYEKGLKRDTTINRDMISEIPIGIVFAKGTRNMTAELNYDKCYLATQNGTTYDVSKEFVGYVKEFYETDKFLGTQIVSGAESR